jgi:putative DNA primase/helicase
MTDLLSLLKGVARSGSGWTAKCPAHDDQHRSLSVDYRDGHWLVKCHAGCAWHQIVDAVGLKPGDLFDDRQQRKGGRH